MHKDIAIVFKEVRARLKLTVRDFAKPLGISPSYVSAIENGKRVPSDTLTKLMLSVYKVSEVWLATGGGDMFAKGHGTAEGHIEPELAQAIAKKLKAKYEGKAIELTGEELMAVQMLRDLSGHDRKRIMHTLQMAWTAWKVEKG